MGLITGLVQFLELSEADVLRILKTAPHRYKVYPIEKRSGVGTRLIAQPARELKLIQRYVSEKFLSELPVHRAATAYVKGKSIRQNAFAHRTSRAILKLDFKDFFNSIVYRDLRFVFEKNNYTLIDRNEWRYVENVIFWRNPATNSNCLSIGAPTSPLVSNVVMFDLDEKFDSVCRELGVTYTRYADDITLSGKSIDLLLSSEKSIRSIVRSTKKPQLTFNDSKRGVFTARVRRFVTGLVITPQKKVSLGRNRKRTISAAVHHVATGRNTTSKHIANTRGWLAYAKGVEPKFFKAMERKYGLTVKQIMVSVISRYHEDGEL